MKLRTCVAVLAAVLIAALVATAGGESSPTVTTPHFVIAAETGASSAANGARLSAHLRQWQDYGEAGYRELESGRIRYYGNLDPADKPGVMVGRRFVREWDPETGYTRSWHETLDQDGNVRIVRPETGGPKTHYYFDEFGNYGGSW